jgi:quinol monooxygenase YgiN
VTRAGPEPKLLLATFTALPGQEQAVSSLLASLALQVRREPGNLRFEPFRVTANAQSFIVFEAYADQQAFLDHVDSAHSTRFNSELAELITEPHSVLTWLEGVGGR